jgi:hypothetical protein
MKKLLIAGFALLALVAFTAPAFAETHVGGLMQLDFYWWTQSKEVIHGGVAAGQSTAESDNTSVRIITPAMARFNVRWTNENNVGMYFELGVGGVSGSEYPDVEEVEGVDSYTAGDFNTANNGVNLRFFYGWWDVTPKFQMLAGWNTTPFSILNPYQLVGEEANLKVIGIGYGEWYSGRFPQLRFGYFPGGIDDKTAGVFRSIEIAFIDPHAGAWANAGNFSQVNPANPSSYPTPDSVIPRIDVGARIYAGPVKIYPSIMWQRQSFDDVASGDDSINSWGAALGAIFGIGPVDLRGEFNYGQNVGNTRGAFNVGPHGMPGGTAALIQTGATNTTSIFDTTSWGWWIDASMKMGFGTPHLVIGQARNENDEAPVANQWETTTMMIGVSCPISLAKGFTLIPEIFYWDNGDDNKSGSTTVDNGTEWTYGVEFMVAF